MKQPIYDIENMEKREDELLFSVKLMAEHPIFKGHFPDHPILPGIISIYMVKDCFSQYHHVDYTFFHIIQCKFIKIIDPTLHSKLNISVKNALSNDNKIELSGKIFNKIETFVTLKILIV
ncbi:MAG: hypothetical protein RR356_02790 [Bacteroidales bacterium]